MNFGGSVSLWDCRVVTWELCSVHMCHFITPLHPIQAHNLSSFHLDILTLNVHIDWLLSLFSTALSWWFSHTTWWIFIKACGWTEGFTVMQVMMLVKYSLFFSDTVCEFSWRWWLRLSVHVTLTFTHCWICSPATGNAESHLDWYFCDWSGWYLWP